MKKILLILLLLTVKAQAQIQIGESYRDVKERSLHDGYAVTEDVSTNFKSLNATSSRFAYLYYFTLENKCIREVILNKSFTKENWASYLLYAGFEYESKSDVFYNKKRHTQAMILKELYDSWSVTVSVWNP